MKVWVLEPTDYDEYGIYGVFASLEAAKAFWSEVTDWQLDAGSWWSKERRLHIYETEVGE